MKAIDRIARHLVFKRLHRVADDRLLVHENRAVHAFGAHAGTTASIRIIDPRFYGSVALGGHIGAAEAYANGWWTTDDLTAVIRLFVRNRAVMDDLETGFARLVRPIRAAAHALNRNSRAGSRRNIAAHYDLGNEFFSLILDETMTYSSGYFERPNATLADASRAKYDRLCRKLELGPSDHVIEIGTGWGGFAIHAARHYGCRVTTTTISREQFQLAQERVTEAGLDNRITVLLSDYRDLKGEYDKLISIEMIEAVGHQFFGEYFAKCAALLKSNGLAAIQAITIQDRYYDDARRNVDFIKRYIFPGSCLPAVGPLMKACGRTDLRLVHAEDFGPHYARTLREWHRNLDRNSESIGKLGHDDFFQRIWKFYFAYCEGGFSEGVLGVSQLVFAKPAAALEARSSSFSWQASAA
ncbi:MAG: class I SAM-dependent methyltransferase [Gemmatimonadota bacterium]|nr:MAG: class I SAM-dependent methyltransferase [Gemmatimonadota bacterium]